MSSLRDFRNIVSSFVEDSPPLSPFPRESPRLVVKGGESWNTFFLHFFYAFSMITPSSSSRSPVAMSVNVFSFLERG